MKKCVVIMTWKMEDDAPEVLCVYSLGENETMESFLAKYPKYTSAKYRIEESTIEEA